MYRVKPLSRASRSISQTFKRFNSAHHHHPEPESKPFEITITKIFGIAALAGGYLVYNRDFDEPLFQHEVFDKTRSGERDDLRSENYLQRYKNAFISEYGRDKGGIGNRLYRRAGDYVVREQTLIPSQSPFAQEFGAGIKLNELGPRRERFPRFAPKDTTSTSSE
ncbi:uncharacterized protein SPAPADRAFT_62765 [Spathaspora passalidarum NRRL Y-27907]|uniref:Uncharacterized protein n=1 Tax=Spathaspora passalidarum (strain NRRL Y-27907 / 11-Y1) TaxID=619300 RepID=G3ATA3_SPAPN|nr:uncharacterized protein SPAPADRAFT_62765 [Spathaspora passalidarum NRRL Y-27907]EGW30866.1 hypothetical protein SPAPADRAFT_62765 [Spathaspora passalidarum NRRL Y-27907]